MTYGSVCSGIESATVAWHPLGWRPAFFAEIAKFPSRVLAHHYPSVPNHGDFTTIQQGDYEPIELLVGGTPCQDFSVAGLRKGMDGERGQLTVEFARLAGRLRPRWVVWENVPGVLSIDGGRAFGAFLGMLGELGYGVAYRVLDAQHFGVPQRRRRVFVVGHLGDWRRAAAVLFERHSLSGDTAPRREARKAVAGGVEVGPSGGRLTDTAPKLDTRCKDGFIRNQLGAGVLASTGDIAHCLNGGGMGRQDFETETLLAVGGFPDSAMGVAIAFTQNQAGDVLTGDVMHSLGTNSNATGRNATNVAIGLDSELNAVEDGSGPLKALGDLGMVSQHMAVRRLVPEECEALQGFPRGYTRIPVGGKWAADGPRYKALGNSKAVPVVRWLGERIAMVDSVASVALLEVA